MGKEEKILLGLSLAALAGVVLFNLRPARILTAPPAHDPLENVGESLTYQNEVMTRGPKYLQFNTPWMFSPPVGNFLPSVTAGQGNQTVNQPTDFQKTYRDECNWC